MTPPNIEWVAFGIIAVSECISRLVFRSTLRWLNLAFQRISHSPPSGRHHAANVNWRRFPVTSHDSCLPTDAQGTTAPPAVVDVPLGSFALLIKLRTAERCRWALKYDRPVTSRKENLYDILGPNWINTARQFRIRSPYGSVVTIL